MLSMVEAYEKCKFELKPKIRITVDHGEEFDCSCKIIELTDHGYGNVLTAIGWEQNKIFSIYIKVNFL